MKGGWASSTAAIGTAVGGILLGVAGCSTHTTETVIVPQSSSAGPVTARHGSTAAKPAVTKTVVRYRTATPAPSAPPAAAPVAAPPAPAPAPNVTDPWAVVSAYYGDIESQNYVEAYALLSDGMTTGQTYQQFADGFACTGSQQLTENWESGDEVNFSLAAYNSCSGSYQYFTGTDTVEGGKIVAANVVQTG
jgi:hypothetical protein